MAHPLHNPKIGDLAYPAFQPQKAGIIIEIVPKTDHLIPNVKIQMANGSSLKIHQNALQDFNALIEDHKKKLNTHLVTFEKLQKIKNIP